MTDVDSQFPAVTSQQPRDNAPDWYTCAVFYELAPRAFFDSNGDGVGDLEGIVEKLNYLAWLGVDCIWVLPFYPSPWRDDGYDVSDYVSVAPMFGSLDDFSRLVNEVHARGMRIVIDLVLQHTSDADPWFQESRSSKDNPKADWYIWSDTDQIWSDVR